MPIKKEAVLLFSGGRDSSLAAIRLIEMGYEIHLLTFDNGAIEDIARSNLRLAEFNDEIKENIITRKIIHHRFPARRIVDENILIFKK